MNNCLSHFLDDESAVSATEYALFTTLVTVAVFASVVTVGDEVLNLYTYIKDRLVLTLQ
ncbi:Flp family type IVb pilin [Massilia sp. NR 4-1]|uniref:Flp family type IVb pilin n=1 Tax=Massilia sp. NR 4-1 TaxID=1678028 RepID=UPI000B236BBA|nr:Flp family type IVb pilin [Massilia sp. NR 4-1]